MDKTKIDWCDSTWKKIPGYENYFISRNGDVLSTKKRKPIIMKPISAKDGYMYVFLYNNGVMKKMWIHRAVLMSWDRLPKEGEEARHLNDVPIDNRLENLCWGTRTENVEDKRRNGGIAYGERAVNHKLTSQQVLEIRERYSKGESSSNLSEEYKIAKNTVIQIAKGNKWRHLPTFKNEVKHSSQRKTPISDEQIKIGTKALNQYAASIRKKRVSIYCVCGCGNILETPDSKGRERKYIRGHNARRQQRNE